VRNVSSIYNNIFIRHKNTEINTISFGSKLLPSSGETANPKTQLSKNVTPINITDMRETKTNTSKNINTNYTKIKNYFAREEGRSLLPI
jgi:hypothetical protein